MGWDGYGAQDMATHGFGSMRSRAGGAKRRKKAASGSCNGCTAKARRKKATRRTRSSASRSSALKSARASVKAGKRLVKGSAAAKAYMASIRKLRK
jgi:hypothetical protein